MRRLRVLVVSLVLFGSLVEVAPAHAKVYKAGHLIYVTASNLARAGFASPRVSAVCPSGSRAMSAGGGSSAIVANARLSQIQVVDQIRAETELFNTSTRDLTLSAVAVCLRAPLGDSVSVPSTGVAGTLSSSSSTTSCGAATRVGGGAGVTPPAAGRYLFAARPTPNAYFGSFGGPAIAGSEFIVRAACLPAGSVSVQTVAVGGVAPANGVGSAKARCPRGTQVSGGGVFGGALGFGSSRPFDHRKDRDRAPDDGWSASVFNPGGSPAAFQVDALCIRIG